MNARPVESGNDLIDLLRLARAEGVGPITFGKLLTRYETPAAALDALPALARGAGRAAAPAVPTRAEAEREIAALDRLGGRFLFAGRPGYPELLSHIPDRPAVIAVLGDHAAFETDAVAIVGGRNASANGQKIAEQLGRALAEAGIAVVSGMARGVDAAAHRGALAAGRTIAAVAGGLDVPYPPEHADLQRAIAGRGAVVAEAPLGTTPQARHFPRRNRLIAGLSQGVVVVEAAIRSGSLITARLAHEYGRDLFAVPGSPLDPRCHGSNDLLRQGAHLTETVRDVIDNLPPHPRRAGSGAAEPSIDWNGVARPAGPVPPEDATVDADAARAKLVSALSPTPISVDDLVRRCQLSVEAVMSHLVDLELAGRLETLPGNRVALV
jgi:DNA processing protein